MKESKTEKKAIQLWENYQPKKREGEFWQAYETLLHEAQNSRPRKSKSKNFKPSPSPKRTVAKPQGKVYQPAVKTRSIAVFYFVSTLIIACLFFNGSLGFLDTGQSTPVVLCILVAGIFIFIGIKALLRPSTFEITPSKFIIHRSLFPFQRTFSWKSIQVIQLQTWTDAYNDSQSCYLFIKTNQGNEYYYAYKLPPEKRWPFLQHLRQRNVLVQEVWRDR